VFRSVLYVHTRTERDVALVSTTDGVGAISQ
jgi:hypothetical protein